MDLRPTLEMIRFSRLLLDTHAQFKFQRKSASTTCCHIGSRQLVSSKVTVNFLRTSQRRLRERKYTSTYS